MHSALLIVAIQTGLLIYHQITTWFDFSPFNGVEHYTTKEKLAETGVNFVLMSLAPTGYALNIHGLMLFGLVYYFALLSMEIIIWWIPYLARPVGQWRKIYNGLLAVATSNMNSKDALGDWLGIHNRLHAETITVLPRIPGRIVPNLEHIILHAWTAITAATTALYYFQ